MCVMVGDVLRLGRSLKSGFASNAMTLARFTQAEASLTRMMRSPFFTGALRVVRVFSIGQDCSPFIHFPWLS